MRPVHTVRALVDGEVRYFKAQDVLPGISSWVTFDRADKWTRRRDAERVARRYQGATVETSRTVQPKGGQ